MFRWCFPSTDLPTAAPAPGGRGDTCGDSGGVRGRKPCRAAKVSAVAKPPHASSVRRDGARVPRRDHGAGGRDPQRGAEPGSGRQRRPPVGPAPGVLRHARWPARAAQALDGGGARRALPHRRAHGPLALAAHARRARAAPPDARPARALVAARPEPVPARPRARVLRVGPLRPVRDGHGHGVRRRRAHGVPRARPDFRRAPLLRRLAARDARLHLRHVGHVLLHRGPVARECFTGRAAAARAPPRGRRAKARGVRRLRDGVGGRVLRGNQIFNPTSM
mmetsp:Transcript_13999/g.48162  ORF Transcript_13999/g.48162 Transcript_13999/m.48162 type:complete len:278 (-) Transcript_13999:92-925(-)